MDMTVNRIATEAYVSPIRPIKPVTSNTERAEIADRLKEAVRAAPPCQYMATFCMSH